MKLIQLQLILFLLFALGNNLNVLAQQDSIEQQEIFQLFELKQISKLLDEVEYRRVKDSLTADEVNLYQRAFEFCKAENDLYQQKEEVYKNTIEAVTPEWYDKPLFVSGVTGFILTIFYILIK